MTTREQLADAEHWVVKIGSSVFLRDDRHVDRPTFTSLVRQLDELMAAGHRITLVSSGAVALGREHLGWAREEERDDVAELQALAAMGQSRLVQMYENEFAHYDQKVAQILFSRADLDDRERFLNARKALNRLRDFGAIPIINENDSVATEELRFGDNDRLAAMTCGVERADVLVLLSDVAGIFERDDTGEFGDKIPAIDVDDPTLDRVAGPSETAVGTGGMVSKVIASRMAARLGASTVVAPGRSPGVLESLRAGDDVGTLIRPGDRDELEGKKVWLGAGARAVGTVVCDEGARRAIVHRGASLLPSGITAVDGEFSAGSVVELVDPTGESFARGVAVYSADDLRAIAGCQSNAIEEILGYRMFDCAVHRDSLVLLEPEGE